MQHTMSCFVPGVPIPKGSTKAFPFKRKNGKMGVAVTAANSKTKPWQAQVAAVAKKELAWSGVVWAGPISLTVCFVMPRPKSLPKKVLYHLKKPDLDKLLRSVKDALKGIAYVDDSQVIATHATKCYGQSCSGASITIERVTL